MLTAIISKLLGLLTTKTLSSVLDYLKHKQQAKTQRDVLAKEIAIKYIETELELRKTQAEIIKIESGWWVTALIRPLFAYPLILWWSAVILDSIFQFPWDVAALPSPLDEWAGWIIGAYFISRPMEKIARSFIYQMLHRSS